jgi:hypothetical protein
MLPYDSAWAMSRALEWTPAAERDLRRIDPQIRERIRQAVYRLVDTGHGDVRRLQGRPREWRLRWRCLSIERQKSLEQEGSSDDHPEL